MCHQLLSDPESRKQFDLYGIVGDSATARERRETAQQHRWSDPLDSLFDFAGVPFRFRKEPDITLFHKLSITARLVIILQMR